MAGGLFPVENPYDRARSMMSGAVSAAAAQKPNSKTETTYEKTAAGGLATGGMGAYAGAQIASTYASGMAAAGGATAAEASAAGSAAGPYGLIIGGALGLLAYFLS